MCSWFVLHFYWLILQPKTNVSSIRLLFVFLCHHPNSLNIKDQHINGEHQSCFLKHMCTSEAVVSFCCCGAQSLGDYFSESKICSVLTFFNWTVSKACCRKADEFKQIKSKFTRKMSNFRSLILHTSLFLLNLRDDNRQQHNTLQFSFHYRFTSPFPFCSFLFSPLIGCPVVVPLLCSNQRLQQLL